MIRVLDNDRGGVTAEFAVTLPVVLATIGIIVGALTLSATKISLVSAAHDLARLEARGDSALFHERFTQTPSGTTHHIERDGSVTCVTLSTTPGTGLLSRLTLTSRGCALQHPEA